MNTYFITVEGDVKNQNLTRQNAISKAKKLYESGLTSVGIGRKKYKQSKLFYTILPLHFYIN